MAHVAFIYVTLPDKQLVMEVWTERFSDAISAALKAQLPDDVNDCNDMKHVSVARNHSYEHCTVVDHNMSDRFYRN